MAFADTPLPFGLDIQKQTWIAADPGAVQSTAIVSTELDQVVAALDAMQRALGPYHRDLVAPTVAAASLATEAGELALAEAL